MTYTSNYATRKPDDMVTVRISRTLPRDVVTDDEWLTVAPGWLALLKPYKEGQIDDAEYTAKYEAMLERNRRVILDEYEALKRRHRGRDIVLLCWCRRGAFCHRRLLADWLARQTGETIPEL